MATRRIRSRMEEGGINKYKRVRVRKNIGTVGRSIQVDAEDRSLLEGSSIGRLEFLRQLGLTLLAATGLFGVAAVFAGEAPATNHTHSGCVPDGCVKCCHRCCLGDCVRCDSCISRIVKYDCGGGRCRPGYMSKCRHCVFDGDPNGRCDPLNTCENVGGTPSC